MKSEMFSRLHFLFAFGNPSSAMLLRIATYTCMWRRESSSLMWFYCNAVWLYALGIWRLCKGKTGLGSNNQLPNFLCCSVLFSSVDVRFGGWVEGVWSFVIWGSRWVHQSPSSRCRLCWLQSWIRQEDANGWGRDCRMVCQEQCTHHCSCPTPS